MINPVLRREAQTSLRNWKVFTAIALYVAMIAGAAGLFIWGTMFNSYDYGFDPQSTTFMYAVLSGFQLGLILMTTPALSAGSISGERERQTLDLLLITKLSPFSIVIGKLFSSLGIIVLMTIAATPVFGIIFYFGGLSLVSLLSMTAFLLVISLMVGAISIFFSCILKKTIVSMVLVYVIIGLLCGGTAIAYAFYASYTWSAYEIAPSILSGILILCSNPIIGFLIIMDNQLGSSIFSDLVGIYNYDNVSASEVYWVNHLWIINVAVNLVIALIFILLATKFINPSRKK